jgi:hypothetical protein
MPLIVRSTVRLNGSNDPACSFSGTSQVKARTKHYRRIMRGIIAGVGQGPRGIDAANLTASYAVELAFRWTSDYFSALRQYRDKLRARLSAELVAELAAEGSEPPIEIDVACNG